MTNLEYLQEFASETITNLEKIHSNGVLKELSFTIHCKDLEDYNHEDIRKCEKYKDMFRQLEEFDGPTLYWFDIVSNTESRKIVDAIKEYKERIDAKATPALKKRINYNSRILYVGKVKNAFWGRLIQHLGFYKVDQTQGLQLFYWAKELSLSLRVNVFVFEKDMENIMPIFEYAFAKRLQPIIGKHQ